MSPSVGFVFLAVFHMISAAGDCDEGTAERYAANKDETSSFGNVMMLLGASAPGAVLLASREPWPVKLVPEGKTLHNCGLKCQSS